VASLRSPELDKLEVTCGQLLAIALVSDRLKKMRKTEKRKRKKRKEKEKSNSNFFKNKEGGIVGV